MKLLDATFNEYKAAKEAEIKRYQAHIEHLKSQVKEKREALKHFKADAALQAKCRKLAFDSIELENRNTIFDFQKREIHSPGMPSSKMAFQGNGFIV